MIDIATATPDQLREAMSLIATRLAQLEQATEQTEADTRAAVTAAIAGLDALLGPDNPAAPGLNSISEMLKYTDAQLGQYAGLALRQVLRGMQIQARLTRDLASVVGD